MGEGEGGEILPARKKHPGGTGDSKGKGQTEQVYWGLVSIQIATPGPGGVIPVLA